MKEELYRKVFIHSESDLPEYDSSKPPLLCELKSGRIDYFANSIIRCNWEKAVWYLQPIDQPQIDINTSFFGNSGAKIPIEQPTYKHNIGSTTDFKVESIEQPQPEKTVEEIRHKINQIICRYHHDNDYKTKQAENDLFNLLQFKSQSLPQPGKLFTLTHVKNIFRAGHMSCQGKRTWNDAKNWFSNTYLKGELFEKESQSFRLTDEEIDKWADKVATETTGKSKHGHIIKAALYTGAKWYRDMIDNHLKQK